jgi:hypothetical protein
MADGCDGMRLAIRSERDVGRGHDKAGAGRTCDWDSLVTSDGVQVHLERFITGTQQRSEIRTTGSPSRSLSSQDIDVIIVSLPPGHPRPPRHTWQQHAGSAAQRTHKLVAKHHNPVEKEKPRRRPLSDRPFRPLVMSLRGITGDGG